MSASGTSRLVCELDESEWNASRPTRQRQCAVSLQRLAHYASTMHGMGVPQSGDPIKERGARAAYAREPCCA